MANSILQGLRSQQLMNNPAINLFKQLKGAKDPNTMLNLMAQNNPQIKNVMNLINNSGRNPKDLFYEMAKQKGVDPEEILNLFK